MATHDENTRDNDHFERIRLVAEIEKARDMIGKYDEGQAHYYKVVEDNQYAIGRLDERLADA